MKTLDCSALMNLPECPFDHCDVCGHAPIEMWMRGFGCQQCRGTAAVIHATEVSWGKTPEVLS